VHRAVGVMHSYPAPDDDARWDELLRSASSDVEAKELAYIRQSLHKSREAIEAWEGDHPLSRWHRFVLRLSRRKS
jgi:hypothetical protein